MPIIEALSSGIFLIILNHTFKISLMKKCPFLLRFWFYIFADIG